MNTKTKTKSAPAAPAAPAAFTDGIRGAHAAAAAKRIAESTKSAKTYASGVARDMIAHAFGIEPDALTVAHTSAAGIVTRRDVSVAAATAARGAALILAGADAAPKSGGARQRALNVIASLNAAADMSPDAAAALTPDALADVASIARALILAAVAVAVADADAAARVRERERALNNRMRDALKDGDPDTAASVARDIADAKSAKDAKRRDATLTSLAVAVTKSRAAGADAHAIARAIIAAGDADAADVAHAIFAALAADADAAEAVTITDADA